MRAHLVAAAHQIAQNKGEAPASPITAARKLFIQERRDWSRKSAPRIGWKRGELFEMMEALVSGGDWRAEWGDVGYYIAQTWAWLWWLYEAITPEEIIERACEKFERRANKK